MQGSASWSDETRPSAFGPFIVRLPMGAGRFGPVFRGEDPSTDQPVVIRTFSDPRDPDAQARLVDALTQLCETPLEHAAIARPLAAGIDSGRVYLVHALLPGIPLDQFVARHGPQPFRDVVLRTTQMAGAIDFAAAAGIHHGTLGPPDAILSGDGTGISGFGLMQAMEAAELPLAPREPGRREDVRALAMLALTLLGKEDAAAGLRHLTVPGADNDQLRRAFHAALQPPDDSSLTALAFAAALQESVSDEQPAAVAAAPPVAPEDLLLRPDEAAVTVPAAPLMFGAREPVPASGGGSGWLLAAATLAIGILSGFIGGYIVGQRGDPLPVPRFAAEALRRPAEPAPSQPGATAPAPTSGQSYSDGRVDGDVPQGPTEVDSAPLVVAEPGGAAPPAASPSPEPLAAPSRTEPPAAAQATPGPTPSGAPDRVPAAARQAEAPRPDGPGGMQVLSRPDGAEVIVDGARVGRTPLVLPSVRAGAHTVRLELSGYRNWVATVQVESGARARVAASLEQQ